MDVRETTKKRSPIKRDRNIGRDRNIRRKRFGDHNEIADEITGKRNLFATEKKEKPALLARTGNNASDLTKINNSPSNSLGFNSAGVGKKPINKFI